MPPTTTKGGAVPADDGRTDPAAGNADSNAAASGDGSGAGRYPKRKRSSATNGDPDAEGGRRSASAQSNGTAAASRKALTAISNVEDNSNVEEEGALTTSTRRGGRGSRRAAATTKSYAESSDEYEDEDEDEDEAPRKKWSKTARKKSAAAAAADAKAPPEEADADVSAEELERVGASRDELNRLSAGEAKKALGHDELYEEENGGKAAKTTTTKGKKRSYNGRPPPPQAVLARIGRNINQEKRSMKEEKSSAKPAAKVYMPPPRENCIIDPMDLPEKLRKKVLSVAGKIGYEAALKSLGITRSEFGKMGYKGLVDKTRKEHGVDEASAKTLIGQEIYAAARAKAKEEGSTSKLRCPEVRYRETDSENWIELEGECGHVIEVGDKTGKEQPDWYTGDNYALECQRYCSKCKAHSTFRPPAVVAERKAASGTYECKACKVTTVVPDHRAKWNVKAKGGGRCTVTCQTCKDTGKGPVKSKPGRYRFIEKHWKAPPEMEQQSTSGTYRCNACSATTVIPDHKAKWNKKLKCGNRLTATCKSCKVANRGPRATEPGRYAFYDKYWKEC